MMDVTNYNENNQFYFLALKDSITCDIYTAARKIKDGVKHDQAHVYAFCRKALLFFGPAFIFCLLNRLADLPAGKRHNDVIGSKAHLRYVSIGFIPRGNFFFDFFKINGINTFFRFNLLNECYHCIIFLVQVKCTNRC